MALASFSTLPMRPQNRRSFFPSKLSIKSPLRLHNNNSTPSLHAAPAILISSNPSPPLTRQSSTMSLNSAASHTERQDLNTLPDPRSPAPEVSRQSLVEPEHHPGLSDEVAALSTKLVNALNYQTDLDDSLQSTRQELEAARERVTQLEQQNKEHQDQLSQGLLIKRADSTRAQDELKNEIEKERVKRNSAEQAKKGMEQELEALTGQLFEEANSMVASARREKEESEQRNEQLKVQLQEAEILLASHQAQLRELKSVLHTIQNENEYRDETFGKTAPSTPLATATMHEKSLSGTFDSLGTAVEHLPVPYHPLYFTQLVQPVMRTDIQAYEEFGTLLRSSANSSSTPSSRVHSGNFGGLNVMGLSGLGQISTTKATPTPPTNVPSSALTTSSPGHTIPGSFHPTTPPEQTNASYSKDISLKDSKFYKRAMTEDIEPTLRLDLAPGLSWLARRAVLNSMATGSLMVDPFAVGSRYYSPAFPCALCGEYRKQPSYLRTHRFRTSDSDDAQRYPVCDFCLARLRATADFVGFIRNVKNGHWKAESEEDERAAWEECTKLRERMFWARLGGGVVPALASTSSEVAKTSQSVDTNERKESHTPDEDDEGNADTIQDQEAHVMLGSPLSQRPKNVVLGKLEPQEPLTKSSEEEQQQSMTASSKEEDLVLEAQATTIPKDESTEPIESNDDQQSTPQ